MVETKTKKTGAIIGTVAASVLCGCPAIALCVTSIIAFTGQLPYSTTVNGVSDSGMVPGWAGFIGLCLSVIFVAVPVVVGVLTLRKKPATTSGEPLPPVS